MKVDHTIIVVESLFDVFGCWSLSQKCYSLLIYNSYDNKTFAVDTITNQTTEL